jgi:DMSO/TMAO reductase YedYZ molybdopterin-dependent catalytic subunit
VKKSNIAIIVIIVVLIALIAIISAINKSGTLTLSGDNALLVRASEKTLREYTVEEIKSFPPIEVYKRISSSKGEDEEGVFTGVPLETLLSDAIPDWSDKYTEFVFTGSDGFTSAAFASDVEKGENVLIVYAKDGEDLSGPDAGGKGPLRVVIVDDPFGNRSTYLLMSIEAK